MTHCLGMLRRLDPRTKLALLVALIAPGLAFVAPPALAAWAGLLLILMAAGLGRALPWRPLLFVLLVAAFSYGMWMLFDGGFRLSRGFVRPEVARGHPLTQALRCACVYLAVLFSSRIGQADDIYRACVLLRAPYPFAFLVGLTIQFIPRCIAAARSVYLSQAMRGLDLSHGTWRERSEGALALLVPLLLSVLRQNVMLTVAVESRAFGFGPRRTQYFESHMRTADYVVALLSATVVAATVAAKFLVHGV